MQAVLSFGEILEVVNRLPLDEQESLIDVIHRRIIEQRRNGLVKAIQEAKKEFEQGKCQIVTPDDIMSEILA
jgi:hypothetical protein